jgi:hypothetical protein
LLSADKVPGLRRHSKPNTYAISGPSIALADVFPTGRLGADLDQVRVFPDVKSSNP